MAINIRTSNFDVFNKIASLRFNNEIIFENTAMNRRHLAKIINNINYSKEHIEAILSDTKIIIKKKNNFKFNIYHIRR